MIETTTTTTCDGCRRRYCDSHPQGLSAGWISVRPYPGSVFALEHLQFCSLACALAELTTVVEKIEKQLGRGPKASP